MKQAVFYHVGSPACVSAEREIAQALDPGKCQVQSVHLGEHPDRIAEAERAGVKSIPALVIDGTPFHINVGISLEALKAAHGDDQEVWQASCGCD